MPRVQLAPLQWFGIDDDGLLHAKRVDEDWVLVFDFARRLASGETLSSATWTCSVHAGTDADAADMISGDSTESGTKSSQKLIDGVDGVTYYIRCALTTSQQVIFGEALLIVSNQVRSDGTFR